MLVVDDVRSNANIVRTLLRGIGLHDIDQAFGGVEAFDRVKARGYGLIVSDYRMDGLDGLGLLRLVRRNPGTERTPFLMMSGHATLSLVTAAKRAGVDAFLAKPFSAKQIGSYVMQLLRQKQDVLELAGKSDNGSILIRQKR